MSVQLTRTCLINTEMHRVHVCQVETDRQFHKQGLLLFHLELPPVRRCLKGHIEILTDAVFMATLVSWKASFF